MKSLAAQALLLSCLLQATAAGAQYGGSAPVCVVEVKDKGGQVLGTCGKAFAARIGNKDVLVTTAHGISGLMSTSPNPATMFTNVGTVALLNLAGQEIGSAGECLLHDNRGGDLLLFNLPSGCALQPLPMAQTLPAPGTRVFVLSKAGSNFSNSPAADRYEGRILQSAPDGFGVHMSTTLDALHSSGSPVVDEQNNVVGMLIGVSGDRSRISCIPASFISQIINPQARVATPAPTAARAAYSSSGAQSYGNGVRSYGSVQNSRSGVQTYGVVRSSRNHPQSGR